MQDVRAFYSAAATLLAPLSTTSLIGSGSDSRKCSPTRSLKTSAIQHSRRPVQSRLRHRKTANVLFAEDDQLIRNVNTQILRQAGYRTTPVEDGLSAWEALNIDAFDLF